MPGSILVVCYDTSTGRYLGQKAGSSQIADGAITSGKIASGIVGTVHLVDGAVTSAKIASGYTTPPGDESITSAKLASGAVIGDRIADVGIFSGKIASGAIGPATLLANAIITSAKIASGQVGGPHIYPSAITSAKIASGQVGMAHIYPGAVTSAKIGALAVGTPHIANQAITSGKIGANVIGPPHLERFASGKIIVGQGTGTNPILKDQLGAIEFVIDGGGSVITSGQKGHLEIPFPLTIDRVTMLADQSGYITVDIWKDAYANFPPTSVDSICSGAKPSLSASDRYQDSVLSGWVRTIASGDILAYDANIASNIQRCTVSLGAYK